ncbi:MAG: hypothetical protein BGO01_13115 [Armatimonadetes bacterium 55-13]|nr:MAG: hypothetical protein ABT09_01335 [bacterium SCN 57-13]OJU61932.1 MAG: hypothetical protein BGO01_13115 [Armatimonadetes bacterium 55-13]
MCGIEGKMLQQGMYFRTVREHSILLMSQRPNAPYPDRLSNDGQTLYYIGHDAYGVPNKAREDQPLMTPKGTLTQNGKFFQAAEAVRQGARELVRVYEKIQPGIWSFNGVFELRDAKMEFDRIRKVCVFELRLTDDSLNTENEARGQSTSPGRLIPTQVKLKVYKRDGGKCVRCGSTENLHFDHILPFSLGGSSTNPENIQLLCQSHNLSKSNRISY